MTRRIILTIAASLAAFAAPLVTPANASMPLEMQLVSGGGGVILPISLQCVPYARAVSGIQIFGDAHTWWEQAEGRYARGYRPKVGAVMAFKPYGKMELGHVAEVSRIIDSRTVLLRHANWSLINGSRGQIENDVRAVDASPANDWSEVRVWFDPIQNLGTTHWPVQGFIYPDKPGKRTGPSAQSKPPQLADTDPIGAIIAGTYQ